MRSFDCPNIAISLWFHQFPELEENRKEADLDADVGCDANGRFFWAYSRIGIAGMIRIILPFRA